MKKTIRLFISSPGDVERERLRTRRLIERIGHDYTDWAELKPYFWEHEPHDPSVDFTTSIGPTSDYDIVVVILWSRLGNRLHSTHRKKDGEIYRSGTEYEVLTALEGQERSPGRLPKLAVFLNTSPVQIEASATDESRADEQLSQYRRLKSFFTEHFQEREMGPDGDEILTNKRAYSAYKTLDCFEELLEKQLRLWIETLLEIEPRRSGTAAGGVAWRPEATWVGNPFQGLAMFEAEQAPIYFGRTRAIGDLAERVRDRFDSGRGFVLVFGASGSGKSSLVRAGLLPLVTEPNVVPGVSLWRQAILKPSDGGSDPFTALAAALLRGGALSELGDGDLRDDAAAARAQLELGRNLRQGPAAVVARIEETLRGVARLERERQASGLRQLAEEFERENRSSDAAEARERASALALPKVGLLLVVDQMEELYTGVTKESRMAFLDAVTALAGSRPVMVIATLRSDFFAGCEEHEVLMALKEEAGSYHLQPPTRIELGQMIREPARSAGVVFEEHPELGRLDERILKEAEMDPDSLPLLEFCLGRLYEAGHGDGLLTHGEYEEIGELGGVLSKHAEAVFDELAAHEQGSLEEVIRALATLGGQQGDTTDGGGPAVVRRVAPYASVTAMPGAAGLVDHFIDARLFTAGSDAEGTRVVSVTHEALLRKWDRVSAWLGLDENRRFLEVRARVVQRWKQWQENGEDRSFLLQAGRELEEAENQYAAYPRAFHEAERDFILLSRAQVWETERRRAKIRRAVMAALGVLTLVSLCAAGWAGVKQREAVAAREKTQIQLEHSQLEEGRAWLERAKAAWVGNKEPLTALMLAARAVGFHGFGRRDEESPKVVAAFPDLLGKPMTADPENEAARQEEVEAVRDFVDGIRPTCLPIWSSPVQSHHTKGVNSVAFSPNGMLIASGSDDKTVKLWDLATGSWVATFIGHTDGVTSVAFSPDGTRLASGSGDRTVKLWDVATGSEVAMLIGHGQGITSVAFSWDGTTLASGSEDDTLKLWEVATGKEVATLFAHREGVTSVAFSPDGTRLASGSRDGPVTLWDVATGKDMSTLEGHWRRVTSLSFSPDGRLLASGSIPEGTVRLWDVVTGKEVMTLEGHSVAFNRDGTLLASGSDDKRVKLWNIVTGKEVATLDGHLGLVTSVSFSPDGTRLASGSEDKTVKLWDVATGKEVATRQGHSDAVTSVRFSPDGTRLASGSHDKTVKIWDVVTGKAVATLEGHSDSVTSVSFSPDGTRLASGSHDKTVKIWDVLTGKEVMILKGHSESVTSLSFSPDGTRLASGSYDKTLKLWEVGTGKEVATVKGNPSPVTTVSFSPDGTRLASGLHDKTVKIWDVVTGAEVMTLKGHSDSVTSVGFSPDGTRVASGSDDNTVKLWDMATGKAVVTLEGHSSSVLTVSFNPDGTRLASGSYDKTVKLWEVATGKEVATLKAHSSSVATLSFSPDGTSLVSGSWDNTVKLWNITPKNDMTRLVYSSFVICLGFSPDGTRLASGSVNGTVTLWDVPTGKEVATLARHSHSVTSVSFSPDGTRLASGADGGTVKLWDVATGNCLATLSSHSVSQRGLRVASLSFSPDGTRLASVSVDHTVNLWDVATGKYTHGKLDFPLLGNEAHSSPNGRVIANRLENVIQLEFTKSQDAPNLYSLIEDEILSFVGREVELISFSPSLFHAREFTPRHYREDELSALAAPDLSVPTAEALRLQLMARTSQWRAARAWWARFHGDDSFGLRSAYLSLLLTSARDPIATAAPSSVAEITAEITDNLTQNSAGDLRVSLPLAQHLLRMVSEDVTCPEPILEAFVSKVQETTTREWQEGVATKAAIIRDRRLFYGEDEMRLSRVILSYSATHPDSAPRLRAVLAFRETDDPERIAEENRLLVLPDAEAGDFINAAYGAVRLKDVARTKWLFEQAETRFPDDESPGRMAGWSFINLDDRPAALAAFERCIASLKPEGKPDTGLLSGLAIAQWLNQRSDDAIATYTQLIETGRIEDPTSDWADPKTIAALIWPEAEKAPLKDLRMATLSKHPELALPTAEPIPVPPAE